MLNCRYTVMGNINRLFPSSPRFLAHLVPRQPSVPPMVLIQSIYVVIKVESFALKFYEKATSRGAKGVVEFFLHLAPFIS